jgi:class 3 adenylate cyclase
LHQRQQDFARILSDTSLINSLMDKNESLQTFENLAKKDYGIYLYSSDIFGTVSMKFWNQQMIVPPPEIHGYEDGEYFMELSNGKYVALKKTFSTNANRPNIVACALILIYSDFFIETTQLPEQFAYSTEAGKRVIISETETSFPIKSISGDTMFGIMAAFLSSADAVRFACQVQEALHTHKAAEPEFQVKVRIGMSAGEPVEHGNDLFGSTVQLAARLCAQADPGQVLVSNAVAELCQDDGLKFSETRQVQLKGFDQHVETRFVELTC